MARTFLLPLAVALLLHVTPAAQAAAVVVNSPITLSYDPAVANSTVFTLAATDTLTVTVTGAIIAPPMSTGAMIVLNGNVTNRGQLRAAWGTELQGLWLAGANNVNEFGGLIETYSLNLGISGVSGNTVLTNRDTLRTGMFTMPDGRELTAFTFAYGGANIGHRATLVNESNGRWSSFSNVVVQGSFVNNGSFESRRNSVTVPAAPASYTPVFTVWQVSDTRQAEVTNTGRFTIGEGSELSNGGLISNQGSFSIANGGRLHNQAYSESQGGRYSGRFENSGTVTVGTGNTSAPQSAIFSNQGQLINSGLFDLDASGQASLSGGTVNSGVMNIRGVVNVGGLGTLYNTGTVRVRRDSLLSFGNQGSGGANAYGGRTYVEGSLLLFGDFWVQGDSLAFNPLAPGLDVLAGGGISVGGANGLLGVTQFGSLRNAGRIDLYNGGTLHGDMGARIENRGQFDVLVGGTLRLEGNLDESFENKAAGTLDVSGVVWGGAQSRLINEGTMVVRAGGSVTVPNIQQVDGRLTIEAGATLATPGGRLTMTGGQLGGNGRINGDVFVEGTSPLYPNEPECWRGPSPGTACFTPGSSPGHMDIDGNLTMGEGAVLDLEIERDAAGVLHWDTVSAGSMSFLQGSLIRVLIGDTAPGAGIENLSFLNCLTGACDFSSASFEVRGGQGGSFVTSDSGLGFAVAAAVPEPGTYALLLAGLGVIGFVARRRSAR